MKGLAIVNVLYGLLFGIGANAEISILVLHLTGRMNAAWILRPARFATLVLTAFMAIIALGAAWGFIWRRRWALWFELAFVACWLAMWALEPLIRSSPRPALELVGLTIANIALAGPALSAWKLQHSVVFNPEYSEAIAATRQIRVMPKFSLKITLIAIALLVVGGVLAAISARP